MRTRNTILLLLVLPIAALAQKDKEKAIQSLNGKNDYYANIAQQIWEFAEPGYLEDKSSALLQSELSKAGFKIERGVAGIPTAFVASYGSGEPIIGILGEFDALPGLSQEAFVPERKIITAGAPGHGCGHNLFGTGSMAAAIETKEWLINNKRSGTIRYYGTPAEEAGDAKVFMVRAGLFDDVDAVITWHAGDKNNAGPNTNLATKSGVIKFYGIAAHAAGAPERGRSALDGVEAMNSMVNLMREHTTEPTRIHYVILKGGEASNVVPAYAEVEYLVRHRSREEVRSLWDRVVKCAEGAAHGTETKVEVEVQGGTFDRLPNEALSRAMHKNLEIVGGVKYDATETAFAEKLRLSFGSSGVPISSAAQIQPFGYSHTNASADTGDVSWVVPTGGMTAATYVPGTPGHSWQAVACTGSTIGHKGMMVAAKTLTLTAMDLFTDSKLLEASKKEFNEKRGPNFKYESLVGDIPPPLDIRKTK
ncbi:MAG TPA: amidohydrolase [Cyclobacteriaceae bacterium]|nr:amidohydrolase [Cyclobacteriaceae bacterium]HRK54002.1 amidohydrolase [Cyclobacteriaceae bacterium]